MKEGDKVKLNIRSAYYTIGNDNPDHPKNVVGHIYHIAGDDLLFVEWPNGVRCVYSDYDLDLQAHLPPIPNLVGCTCDSLTLVRRGCVCEGGQAELERERK